MYKKYNVNYKIISSGSILIRATSEQEASDAVKTISGIKLCPDCSQVVSNSQIDLSTIRVYQEENKGDS